MTVGICGLGLIGGSMAKAYRADGHRVLGCDIDKATEGYALLADIINGVLNKDTVKDCELLFVALYPQKAIDYLKEIAPNVSKNTVVIDLCGTKKLVCEAGFALAEEYGFTYVGGHPMAGKQHSGIKHASATLFKGAPANVWRKVLKVIPLANFRLVSYQIIVEYLTRAVYKATAVCKHYKPFTRAVCPFL